MPKTMATARARYLLLVEIQEEVIAILSGNNRTTQVFCREYLFWCAVFFEHLS
jgi:hypothetical protein